MFFRRGNFYFSPGIIFPAAVSRQKNKAGREEKSGNQKER
jgi:hypothetical protein